MTARKPPAPPGRMIIARSILSSLEAGGYDGEIVVWGMRYQAELHRVSGGVELVLYQPAGGAEPVGAYRQPAIDGEEPRDPDEVLANVTYHPAPGETELGGMK